MSDTEITTPLKEAIRLYWSAEKLLREAQDEDHDFFVLENRKAEVARYEALIQELQEKTTTLVLTGNDTCDYGDERIDIGAIEMLLQRGIIHECIRCEEDEDLTACYDGDHREFHLSEDHTSACISKALHEYDSQRWPESSEEDDELELCNECGEEKG